MLGFLIGIALRQRAIVPARPPVLRSEGGDALLLENGSFLLVE